MSVHLKVNRTEWNEKIDDVVAGLDGPSGLRVHGWIIIGAEGQPLACLQVKTTGTN